MNWWNDYGELVLVRTTERLLRFVLREPTLAITTIHLKNTITFERDGDQWRYRTLDYSRSYGNRIEIIRSYANACDIVEDVRRLIGKPSK